MSRLMFAVTACAASVLSLTAAAAAENRRSYTAGYFLLDVGASPGFLTNLERPPKGVLTVAAKDLLICHPFLGTTCGPQLFIADSTSFTQGDDDYDIIGFGYNPGNCCLFIYSYFANGTFLKPGIHHSIGQSANAILQINGVPEPASWVMLIAGFGLVGASLRNRRHTPA